MIDYIKIEAQTERMVYNLDAYEPFDWKGLRFNPKCSNGNLTGFESNYKGMRVLLGYEKIQLSNSIHKFYKGNNYTDLPFSELVEAIKIICDKFQTEAKRWEIKQLEFGFNIITPKPAKEYLDLFLEYKKIEFVKVFKANVCYERKCYLTEYNIKVYDKYFDTKIKESIKIPENTLRIEVCYTRKRKLPVGIKYLSDLIDRNKFKELNIDFKRTIEKIIIKEEVEYENSTIEERILFNASLNPTFLKYEQKHNKVEAKKIYAKIKQLRERFFRKDFKQWLMKALSDNYIELYCS